MLQSPLIILKRNSLQERDQLKKLDVNRFISGNQITYRQQYNKRNQYQDQFFPIPIQKREQSEEFYSINIPEYVDVEYDLLMWTDFTTQMNELVEQLMPYGGFAWGNESNKFRTHIRTMSFETVNTVGNDRLVRCTVPLTVNGTLLAEQEQRISTLQKRYSIKKLLWQIIIDVEDDIFASTEVPQAVLGARVVVSSASNNNSSESVEIDSNAMTYLTKLIDQFGIFVSENTININTAAAVNPTNLLPATKNEFNVYINGQYIDKQMYNWTPSTAGTQTIVFDTNLLGYGIEDSDTITVNGRWNQTI